MDAAGELIHMGSIFPGVPILRGKQKVWVTVQERCGNYSRKPMTFFGTKRHLLAARGGTF